MADENAGGTVNIISVGVDTAEALTKIKQLERAISSSAGRIASLEKQGLGNSAEANKRRATIQQQRQDLLVLEAGFKSLSATQKAAAETNEAFAKSSVKSAEATGRLTSSLKAAAAASVSAHEAMRAKLLNERAEAAKKAAEWESKLSESVARAAAASVSANEAMRARLLNERAEAAKKAAEWESKLSESVARAAAASVSANEAMRAKLLNERAEAAKKAAEWEGKLSESVARAAAASVSANEAMRAKLLNERAEAAKKAAEWEGKLSESVARAAAASVSAHEAVRVKLLNERAEAAKKAAEWEGKLSESVARAAAASVSANEAMRAKLLNERAEAAKKAAEWEGKLSESVARAAAASVSANEAMRAKLLNERAEAAKKAAAAEDLLYRGSALGVPVLARLSDRVSQGAKGAEALSRGLSNTGNAARTMAGHTHAAALAHDALHSAARGVSGVLGGLWLTYARMLPVLLGVAAATKLVKDSIRGGLDVGFATQFAAILQTENMLGKGQSDAYTNLATLRDDIRKSLISISRESVFTVEQNAQALQKLSLAGVSAQKGLELLTTASNVAVLAQVDLGKATTMVLDTLYNFGMASESSITMAENYAKVSDIMAFTANTVNASFEDIARSFENITGVAGTFNVAIEEASALLQSLAKTGIRGPKAGTYVRNFMDDLLGAPISQRAEKQLDNLNIERYNADLYGEGDFGAAKYIDDLVKSLSELGFVQQQNAIRAITNQRSRRVLRQELIEYKNGLKEVNGELKQTNSLYDRTVKLQADAQGSLARMVEGLTGDAKYQFIRAQSAYNAAVNEAYLYAESDLRGAAQSLQALFRSDEFREMVTGLVTGFASLAKGAAEFAAQAMDLAKYLDGLGGVLATVAKYATALGGAFLAIKGYAAVSATIAGLGGAAAAAAAGVKLLNTALLANPAIAVGTALVATLVYLDQWYEKSKKYEQSLAGRQAKLDELRKAEAEYAAQVERKQSGNRDWLDSLFPEKKLAETRAEIKATVDSIAADMNSALDSVSFQSSFDKILNETDTFLTNMRNAARQAGGDFETEYRNKLVRSIEDADETLKAYAETVANLDQSSAAGKQFAAFMTAWLSGISERAMIAGEELGRLNLILSNQSLKSAAEGLEFGVKDLSQLKSANEELMKSIRALELGEDGLFRYQQEQKKTQLASLENAYAALEFAYSMAAAANAPLAVLEQMQAQMVATAINMGRLTDNIALSQRERELTPAKRGPRPDRDPIRAQLEEARTAIQDFKNSYSEMLGSIQDSTKDLAIGPLEAYERSMRAAAEAYDQMFAAIYKAKNTPGLSANDRQKLQTDENKLLGEANKETRRLVEEYREILEGRSKNLEELEIATGRKVLGAAESWLREYANKYGETVTLLQSDIANLETKLNVAVETGQSDEEVARLAAALKVLKGQLVSFGKSATLGSLGRGHRRVHRHR
jgi:TP901 family phage tail tape measure protein